MRHAHHCFRKARELRDLHQIKRWITRTEGRCKSKWPGGGCVFGRQRSGCSAPSGLRHPTPWRLTGVAAGCSRGCRVKIAKATPECSLSPYMINTGRAGAARIGAHISCKHDECRSYPSYIVEIASGRFNRPPGREPPRRESRGGAKKRLVSPSAACPSVGKWKRAGGKSVSAGARQGVGSWQDRRWSDCVWGSWDTVRAGTCECRNHPAPRLRQWCSSSASRLSLPSSDITAERCAEVH
ncbi:hypothetical protein B0T14DRAFT_92488 [Immersiella caudata]|uniref:Uncharacterized protein n=1 Tax=Immersiella caudata TaxID=314043 RepID=A0AA39X2F2_9PEZI|nr:hypothetical protein B0T14DRAFT_92488 [Immersiella caudata]